MSAISTTASVELDDNGRAAMPANRKIIHADCDCFFAAVEMRDNPRLRSVPMAIGGAPGRRGVISTCNYLAREFGVRSAMASAKAVKLCPQLLILSGEMDKYRQASQQVLEIFSRYTDLIEPLSLDEAFLDVTDSEHYGGSATLIAEQIRSQVAKEVGITISAGVAPNKFLAKVASDWEKPDGLFVIPPSGVEAFVQTLPVAKLPGVGPVTADKLHQRGVRDCGQLRVFSRLQLSQWMGRMGERLFELSRGIDTRPVRTERRRKSLSVERTFEQDLPNLKSCNEQLPKLIERMQARMQRLDSDYQVNGLLVKLKFDDFSATTVESQGLVPELPAYTELLKQGFSRHQRPVRLLGVGVRLLDLKGRREDATPSALRCQLPLF